MKKQITEIRFHGRGGQGAKTAADLLAQTALEAGKHIQSFPEYGPERAGAPMRSYVRISDEVIDLHCGVSNPDIVAVIDPTLLSINPPVTEGVGKEGILLVNTNEKPEDIRKKLNFKDGTVYTVDATKIAYEETGLPLPNTAMLGAIIKATGIITIDHLKDQLTKKLGKKLSPEKMAGNIKAITKAYDTAVKG
ncbi:MAG: pyruvate synthase [Elusimicrobia bacterium RIFOXYA2_FULL_39_19]|nr:MAG: pyruvate synthase [Elusimicrobia bacterium RIFOXYA2_FULL_39_19]